VVDYTPRLSRPFCYMQVSSLMFEPTALNDVLIDPLLQMLSGGILVSGAVLLVLGVSY